MIRNLAVASTLLLLGCNGFIDVQPSLAVVYGYVTDEGATAVPTAFVAVFRDCSGALPVSAVPAGTASTREAGRYRALIQGVHVSRAEACFTVRARPPAGRDLEVAEVVGVQVTLMHESLTPPLDSVRVDLVLSKSPARTNGTSSYGS